MTNVIFTPAARREVCDAYAWYEKEQDGLGDSFMVHLSGLIERITTHPHHFPYAIADVRRSRITRFPYEIYFRERQETIYVIACFHSSRNPTSWQRRV
ncbi:type II toxin-antitoxin system RelE/ParE family toxin [Asticcacaulis solisilvae]|uniref:type II toxin-antitoxin system RelE/ParE family toxin n=1 Tax=Asticcacaulis solisilvae TaxID=1217274 RepID=UPI003FD6EBF8